MVSSGVRTRYAGQQLVYEPQVEYEYAVGGARHRGQRIQFGQRRYSWEDQAREVAEQYPVGATVSVRCDPRRPGRATLRAGRPAGALPLVALGAEVLITALGLALIFADIGPSGGGGGSRRSWVYRHGPWGWFVLALLITTGIGIGIWLHRRKGHYNALVPTAAFGATLLVGVLVLEAVDGQPFALDRLPFVVGVWALAVGAIYLRFRADSRE